MNARARLSLVATGFLLALLPDCATRAPAPHAAAAPPPPPPSTPARASCAAGAHVTITRDDWGVAHVHGRTDEDAVFGAVYAQAEDDFPRIERNYLVALGRLAEVQGEEAIVRDLRQRLYVSDDALRASYEESPAWLRRLMDAWAAGLDCYLESHPDVRPGALTRFEPWMALAFTEGSIGGDVERIPLADLAAFYAGAAPPPADAHARAESAVAAMNDERSASNGIALAPARTEAGHALLLVNPHTSFFFRSELQMTSDQGLDVYGAVTWGQPFVYQGWNDRVGFMHTSSGVDAVDEFAETIVAHDGARFYRYGGEERPLETRVVDVRYRTAAGPLASRRFTTYRTHHGPIVRAENGKWISVALMDRPVAALSQSFLRTKARSFAEYLRVMELAANSSNDTVYADADGVVAYLHPQFVPRRDDRFDYRHPVDGSDPSTDWKGVHPLSELPTVVRPASGYVQNTNDWPFSAAGPDSPRKERFPRYMDTAGENARGLHATALVGARHDFTLERLAAAAFDPFMPAFARMVPALLAQYASAPASATKRALADPIAALRTWDFRWSGDSIPTTLAVTWGEEMVRRCAAAKDLPAPACAQSLAPAARPLEALSAAASALTASFGTWRTPWGDVNRFQRLSGSVDPRFVDDAKSTPVPFTPGIWGSLASFATVSPPGTRHRYGVSGNSFVAVVEFAPDGPRALAVSAGGESGDPASPHFADQVDRYATGRLRPVYFRPADLAAHTARTYHPGNPTPQ